MPKKRFVLEKVSEKDGIAWLILNRPEKKNALNNELMKEFIEKVHKLKENDRIRCIVTTGAGDSYCSGVDLYYLREVWKRKRRWDERGFTDEIVRVLRLCPQITIAAVSGYCLGGGLALVNGHDLAVAADTAKLGMPEIIRGSFGAIATSTLFHTGIPVKKAFYVQLTGRHLSGKEAEKVGLVSKSVPEKKLVPFVKKLAVEIASRDPVALEHAKIAGYLEMDMEFDMALKVDDLVAHRMRYYTNPLADVEGYIRSQKGGGNLTYVKPQRKRLRNPGGT